MDNKYDHKNIEEKVYKIWEDGDYFKPKGDAPKGPYTIVLPPPNANGTLHVGNALMVAIEDLLIRRKRMQGYDALWIPGTDHAGFETQIVFERELEKEGKSRFDYDRAEFYNKTLEFVLGKKDHIRKQIRSLGPSLDWSREKFTLDEDVVSTIYKTFEKMVNDGLVYRDDYMINYCTKHQTTLSELEVEHETKKTPLYYVRYKLVDRKEGEPEFLVVATTRPEPIFVDTHLAVNPKDKKNSKYEGRKVLNPLTDSEMLIIADSFVDPEFGTGIVKLTPAHDKTDYEVAKKHDLPVISAFGRDGRMNELGGELKGLKVLQAREKAVEILTSKGLIEKIDENYENAVSVCFKCGNVIEPLVLPNWFVKVESLKKPAHEALKEGKVKIYPKWQEKKLDRWFEEMRDWPISRQIVWGIRIPAWYDVNKNPDLGVTFLNKAGERVTGQISEILKTHSFDEVENGLQNLIATNNSEYKVSKDKPGDMFLPETDTFDTWFSSGQWPLVTLGYPDSEDFKYYYPTNVLETGWEILRFWVSRMMMFGIYLTGEVPFRDVYFHGLVRAADGRKMSKSLGNQIDPLGYVEQYGADALRMGLISGTAGGKDFAFPHDKVIGYRNFANKIWNMARFMLMMFEREGIQEYKDLPPYDDNMYEKLKGQDKEIVDSLKELIVAVDESIEKYRFADAGDSIYHFMWDKLASEYIEFVKTKEGDEKRTSLAVLRHTLLMCLKLLHPFMPFVTEAIWAEIPRKNKLPLIVSNWPTV